MPRARPDSQRGGVCLHRSGRQRPRRGPGDHGAGNGAPCGVWVDRTAEGPRRQIIANSKAMEAATTVRLAFVPDLLARRSAPKGHPCLRGRGRGPGPGGGDGGDGGLPGPSAGEGRRRRKGLGPGWCPCPGRPGEHRRPPDPGPLGPSGGGRRGHDRQGRLAPPRHQVPPVPLSVTPRRSWRGRGGGPFHPPGRRDAVPPPPQGSGPGLPSAGEGPTAP